MNVNNRADAYAVAAAAQADARALQAADREARTTLSPMRRDTARYEARRLRKRIRAAADALIAFNSQSEEN